jgi:NTP pyrophosphatase (non-canonical NTP hydrolase)
MSSYSYQKSFSVDIETLKLIEELSELLEVLSKSITRTGYDEKIVEEIGDVKARIKLYINKKEIKEAVNQRKLFKLNKIKTQEKYI